MDPLYNQKSDFDIWLAFKQGDVHALDAIFEQYVRVLYNYGRKFTADAELVEDCIQDLFAELWEKRERLSDTTSIKFYLFKALRQKIHRRMETEARHDRHQPVLANALLDTIESTEFHWVAEEADRERKQVVLEALSQLSKRQREAISLRYFDNFSSEETAAIMAVSVESVYKLVSTSLVVLKKHIRKVYLIFWLIGCLSLIA